MTSGPAPQPVLDRLRTHIVEQPNGCWIWVGYVNPHGYGMTHVGSKADGTHRPAGVHRVMYEQLVGPIPEGLDLDHLCRVRCCVNPAHLEPVTRQVNLLRGQGPTARKAAQTHCVQGHEYTPANTMIDRSRDTRRCRTCAYERNRRRYAALGKPAQAKLNPDSVREIRARLRAGERESSLAMDYGVVPGTIYHIKAGLTWRSVTD